MELIQELLAWFLYILSYGTKSLQTQPFCTDPWLKVFVGRRHTLNILRLSLRNLQSLWFPNASSIRPLFILLSRSSCFDAVEVEYFNILVGLLTMGSFDFFLYAEMSHLFSCEYPFRELFALEIDDFKASQFRDTPFCGL